jgi:hypothetical protein
MPKRSFISGKDVVVSEYGRETSCFCSSVRLRRVACGRVSITEATRQSKDKMRRYGRLCGTGNCHSISEHSSGSTCAIQADRYRLRAELRPSSEAAGLPRKIVVHDCSDTDEAECSIAETPAAPGRPRPPKS